jgi:pyruvate formate lyase activating enzyme
MNKRDFLKDCCLGLGGVACGLTMPSIGREFLPLLSGQSDGGEKPGKWSKEALFTAETAAGVLCLKCPNGCVLDRNQTGRCRNRVNYGGKVYSIAYGNPCAVHVDPIEKKPLFHFLPSTHAFSIAAAGCNLACLNCQNWQISQVSPNDTENADLMPSAVVEECLRSHCESIAYTYSEPTTFYEYAYDTATLAKAKRVRNVWKSNGYILEDPLRKLCKVIDAANIDLKTFDDGTYRRLNGGTLSPVLKTLQVFKEEGVWLEITALVIPGWTDDLEMIRKMCDWLCSSGLQDCPLHFTRFTPLYKLAHLPATPVATLEKARDLALKAGIRYVYIGNVPGHLAENTFCHHCHRQVVERRGFVIVQNDIAKGACKHCGGTIPGVWS